MSTPTKAQLAAELDAVRAQAEELARERAALREHAQRLETVRVVGAEIARELDLPAVLRLILRRAVALVGGVSGGVMLWDEQAGLLGPHAWEGHQEWLGDVRWRLGEGVVGTVAATRRGMMVNDYRTSPYAHPRFLERTATAAVLGESLLYRDRLLGVLIVDRESSGGPFRREDQAVLELLADQAAAAIEHARLHSAAMRKGEELEALLRASRTVMAGLDLREILGRIVEEAARISGAPHVKVLLLDADARVLKVGALQGSAMSLDSSLPLGVGSSGIVAQTGEPLFMADAQYDSRSVFAEADRALGIVTYLGLPIKRGSEVLGVLTFNTTSPRDYSPEEMVYLTSFADQAALAIEKGQFIAELQRSYDDLQRTQEELVRGEKLRGLGQMAAGIAHELNNILAAILGQVELLKLRTTEPQLRETLEILDTAATDGAQVVRRLQDFARQRPHAHLLPVPIGPAIQEALDMTRPRWRDEALRRGVVVRVETAVADLPPILGAASEVREALTNLILNAVDAMPDGGTIRFEGRLVPMGAGEAEERGAEEAGAPMLRDADAPILSDGSWVEIAVSDTGVGMDEEVRRRIFDPFFTTKGVRGTGLGLSVVYGIVERHGGSIQVASAPGQGTTVRLRLRPTKPETLHAPSPPPQRRVPAPPRRILLIDDDPTVREALSSLLRAMGHTVTEAAGGAAGLAMLAATPPDLVLTDLGMPEVTGWDVARAVKAERSGLPVILLTGWGDQVEDEEGGSACVDRILGKPVGLQDLLGVIADLTRGC
jgi:signal transduction histidine kinase